MTAKEDLEKSGEGPFLRWMLMFAAQRCDTQLAISLENKPFYWLLSLQSARFRYRGEIVGGPSAMII